MLLKIDSREHYHTQIPTVQVTRPSVSTRDNDLTSTPVDTAELRRLMYERIAQGNGLIEVEENASRKWRTK